MFLDRLVASTAATAAALYLLACGIAWYRLARPGRLPTLPGVRSIILDRAVAWSALAVIFYTVTAIKMGWYHWSDDYLDVVRVVAFLAIFGCGLLSVRAITLRHFGHRVVGWFAALSIAVGLLTWLA